MTNESTPRNAPYSWIESNARKIIGWLPENQIPRGIRSPHFWIIAALMAVLTLVYYGEHTPLAHLGGFFTCDYPHDIHRTLFLFPIIYAAVAFRGWGALTASFILLCVVLPRPFICSPYAAPLLRPLLFVLFTASLGFLTATLIDRMEKEKKTRTALEEGEEQLKKSEERYRNTLNGMLEGCQIVGFDWCYLYVNDVAAEHGRRDKEELLGHTMMEIYPGIEDTEMFARLRYCMEERTSHRMENLFTYPDGSQGWFELRIEPVPEGIFILSIDITEHKQAEEQLIQAEKLTSLGQMAASIAHEVNNPLAGVLVYTQLLAKKIRGDTLPKEVALDYLSKMETELTRSSKLIRNLLDFARQSTPKLRGVNTNEVIEQAFSLVGHQAELQSIQVIKELTPSLPPVMADFDQLQQVFANLILNAIQAMPDGGRLTMRTSLDSNDQVKIEVGDTGCGISEENLHKLFTPFFTTKSKGKGVGLGLAVAYGIIQRHKGRIEVQSEEGKGTTFTIYLKAYHEDKS